jgi:UDP-N-acetyl-2-amino-2-deoxyglucuronate dehydrogenase
MHKEIKILVVGFGRIGQRHAGHIKNFANLAGIVEIDEGNREKAKEIYGDSCNLYSSIDDISSEYDVAAICTPNGDHFLSALKCMSKGMHVLVEKPITLSLSDGLQLLAFAEKKNVRVFAVKQNRFNPPVQFVKALIEDNALGDILSFQLNCFWNRNDAYYNESPWKGTRNLDGGVLFTQFSHFIDLMIWILGNMDVESAFVNQKLDRKIEIEDTGMAIFRSVERGFYGTLNYSINAYRKNMEGSLMIIGSKGIIKIGGQYLNELEYFEVEGKEKPSLLKGNSPNNYGSYVGSMSNHDQVYENLLSVLNNKAEITTSGIEALNSISLIEKIYEKSKYWNR